MKANADAARRPPVLWRGAVVVLGTVVLGIAFLTSYFIIPRTKRFFDEAAKERVVGPAVVQGLHEMGENFRQTWWVYAAGILVLGGLAVSGKIDPVVRLFAAGLALAAVLGIALAAFAHYLPAISLRAL